MDSAREASGRMRVVRRVLQLVNGFADAGSGASRHPRSMSLCDVCVSVPSRPSTPTLARASFRIRSRNIQLVPSGSQRRLEKRYLHFRVHAAARWLLFWSPPAAHVAIGQIEAASLSAHARSSVSIYRRLHRRWLSLGTRKVSCPRDSRVTKRCVLDDRTPYANNHKSERGGI